MVYFGSRQFRNPRRSMGRDERSRVLIMVVVTAGVVGLLLILQLTMRPQRDDNQLPPPASSSPAPALDLPLPVPPPQPLTPYAEDMGLLIAATDGDETGADRVALDYLFQRWLLHVPVTVEEAQPPYLRIPDMAGMLRGRRFPLTLELRNDPELVVGELEGAPRSGLEQYWMVYGLDGDNHLHQIRFAEKDAFLPRETVVEVEADFLRIDRYETRGRGAARVPEWVALRLRPLPPAAQAQATWTPFYLALGIALTGLAALGIIVALQNRAVQRRAAARAGAGSATR